MSSFGKVFTLSLFLLIMNNMASTGGEELFSVDFEIFGEVQGVFFRKFTQSEANKLGLRGWCKNTSSGSVKGVMEGNRGKINEMKNWLQYTGSPASRIDKAVFSKEKRIDNYTYDSFRIKR